MSNLHREGIGSSDAPVIMGVSPYKTVYELWQEMVHGKQQKDNFAMSRGRALEPVARKWFEDKMGFSFDPLFMKHPTISYMTANLDGYNSDKKTAVEIKCPGKEDHFVATNNKVPDKYYPQLQHQLEVMGLDGMYYVSFDGIDGHIVEVARDQKYLRGLLDEEASFWESVLNLEPPNFACEEAEKLGVRQKELIPYLEEYEANRKKLIELANGRSIQGKSFKLTKSEPEGRIEYAKIPELKGVNLDLYRKPSSIRWTLTIS